ncbi:unnamed protein product [Musa hybrid cultivar]
MCELLVPVPATIVEEKTNMLVPVLHISDYSSYHSTLKILYLRNSLGDDFEEVIYLDQVFSLILLLLFTSYAISPFSSSTSPK